jgi:iron complex outermembrane receptor protein
MKLLYSRLLCFTFLAFGVLAIPQHSKAQDSLDVFDMSLEALMGLEITSVSKKAERLQDVATSIYVITQEDIRRSGALRLQDLMAMVPGMWMNFLSFNDVSVGMREGVDDFIGTVLVLVDGVPYQSPYYSSFLYSNYEIDLDEIDRIEVIRGPGGTIYGSNAATGIINIYTKKPEDSQGFRATVNNSVLSNQLVQPSLRFGTKTGENSHVSVFGKATVFQGYDPIPYLDFNKDSVVVPQSDSLAQTLGLDTTVAMTLNGDNNRTTKYSAGLNFTSDVTEDLRLTYNLAYNHHDITNYFPTGNSFYLNDYRTNRLVSRLRLDFDLSENNALFVNAYTNREAIHSTSASTVVTSSQLEVQDNITIGKHSLNIGGNIRHVKFEIGPFDPVTQIYFVDGQSSNVLWGGFVQEKYDITDKFYVMAGVKAEMWDLIDDVPEISPSVRMAFRPNDRHTIWAAGSRSVTTPGFINTNMELFAAGAVPAFAFGIPGLVPGWDAADGTPLGANKDVFIVTVADIDQSSYITGEIGYRGALSDKLTFETTAFYAIVDNKFGVASLNWNNVVESRVDGDSIVPVLYSNIYKSTNVGAETVIKFKPISQLTLEVSHSMFLMESEGKALPFGDEVAADPDPEFPSTPEHVIRFRTYVTLAGDWFISTNGIFATEFSRGENFKYDQMAFPDLTGADGPNTVVVAEPEAYFRLDFKVEKRFNDDQVSVFVWGNDVLNDGSIMYYSRFKVGIPKQVHSMFGAGVRVTF